MKKIRLTHAQLPDSVIHRLSNRDAVLWVGRGFDESSEITAVCDLIQLPWRMVLCESTQGDFAQAVEALVQSTDDQFTRVRGFIHLIASNPEGLTLPPRALPVFLLNGRADALEAPESSHRAGMGQMLRRLNMLNMLVAAKPSSLVVLTRNDDQQIGQLADLWQDGFRSLLSVVSESEKDGESIDAWLSQAASPPAVDFCLLPLAEFARDIVRRTRLEIPEKRLVIRIRASEQKMLDLDITRCELPEQPLLDRYDIIKANDLRVLQPEDLSQEQFTAFFDKTLESWAPYGAGLPWERNAAPRRKTIDTLKRLSLSGSDKNRILFIASESGAGGTTLARSIAFAAASEGFPALLARSLKFRPDATEVASFLFSVRQQFQSALREVAPSHASDADNEDSEEVPWLIVFDVQHWDGREAELRNFMAELTRSGRSVVILVVTGPEVADELRNSARAEQLEVVSHVLDQGEALDLGKHLNRFLKPLGKEKADSEWQRFFATHRPNMPNSVASFWIALEFWLKGHLDLSESIQSWLYRQFKGLQASDDLRCLLLEVAALSIERQPLPEGLMASVKGEELPKSVILEQLRTDAPALALVSDTTGSQRQWAMAHDLLGRYLVNSTYFDRRMLEQLSLNSAIDPVHLRLLLLHRIATRSDIARKSFLPLALELPVKILKLDFGGNTEFFRYWRDVIGILKAMPKSLRDSNRTFNHHVAISCRRVVKLKEYFDATVDEKRDLLRYAISRLEYAINFLNKSPDDESDLNLFNSLSLAYQDLAELEQSQGASLADIRELRAKAEEAARRAHDEGPSNSYVLETMARNVLQNGELYPDDAVQSASEALGFIYQALSLDRSELRQSQLTVLANRALKLLRSSESSERVEQLCAGGNPLGLLAKAWLALTDGVEVVDQRSLDEFPAENIHAAFAVLGDSTEGASWLLLRFRYDLLSVTGPYAFDAQLNLLDELEGTGYRMPYQLQLEQTILLYQRHRPHDANLRFQSLRQELKRYDVIVTVPKRLQWLLTDDAKERRICNAVVVSDSGYRARAKVRDLKDALVPFIPQEFRKSRMGSRETFKCCISFGPMGPFIKPPLQEGVRGGTK